MWCQAKVYAILLSSMLTYFPELNKRRLEKLSDIASDVGLVTLASVVLPAVLDRFNSILAFFGLIATVGFWGFSLWLRR